MDWAKNTVTHHKGQHYDKNSNEHKLAAVFVSTPMPNYLDHIVLDIYHLQPYMVEKLLTDQQIWPEGPRMKYAGKIYAIFKYLKRGVI